MNSSSRKCATALAPLVIATLAIASCDGSSGIGGSVETPGSPSISAIISDIELPDSSVGFVDKSISTLVTGSTIDAVNAAKAVEGEVYSFFVAFALPFSSSLAFPELPAPTDALMPVVPATSMGGDFSSLLCAAGGKAEAKYMAGADSGQSFISGGETLFTDCLSERATADDENFTVNGRLQYDLLRGGAVAVAVANRGYDYDIFIDSDLEEITGYRRLISFNQLRPQDADDRSGIAIDTLENPNDMECHEITIENVADNNAAAGCVVKRQQVGINMSTRENGRFRAVINYSHRLSNMRYSRRLNGSLPDTNKDFLKQLLAEPSPINDPQLNLQEGIIGYTVTTTTALTGNYKDREVTGGVLIVTAGTTLPGLADVDVVGGSKPENTRLRIEVVSTNQANVYLDNGDGIFVLLGSGTGIPFLIIPPSF